MNQVKRFVALLLTAAMLLGTVGCARQEVTLPSETIQYVETEDGVKIPVQVTPQAPATEKENDKETVKETEKETEKQETAETGKTPGQNIPGPSDGVTQMGQTNPAPADDSDRDSLEQIADLVTGGQVSGDQLADMDDEELKDLIEDALEQGREDLGLPTPGANNNN